MVRFKISMDHVGMNIKKNFIMTPMEFEVQIENIDELLPTILAIRETIKGVWS